MRRTAKAMPRRSSRVARAGGTKKPMRQPGSRMRVVANVAIVTAVSAAHCCGMNATRAMKAAIHVAMKRKNEAAAEAAAEWTGEGACRHIELLLLPRLLDDAAAALRAVRAGRPEEPH